MSIGPLIRDLRKAAKMSQADLANALIAVSGRATVTREDISRYENGHRSPRYWLPYLAEVFEVPLEVLESGQVHRRSFLTDAALAAVAPLVPATRREMAGELVSSIAGGDPGPLETVQTSHQVDLAVASVLSTDKGAMRRLVTWLDNGSDLLRVNAAGIVAKSHRLELVDEAARTLRMDEAVRSLYISAVLDRVGESPRALARELHNQRDAGARWCSAILLGKLQDNAAKAALRAALRSDPVLENVRTIGLLLSGEDPCM